MNKQCGYFHLEVGDPYPIWITIRIGDRQELRFSHHDLTDLEYIVESAKRAVAEKLPPK